MRHLIILALCLLASIAPATAAPIDEDKPTAKAPKKATDAQAREALDAFEAEFGREDFHLPVLKAMNQVRALERVGKCDHKLVAKELLKHLGEKEPKVWVAVVDALGNMKLSANLVTPKLRKIYASKKIEVDRLVVVINALGELRAKKMSKEFVKLFTHEEDKVVVAAIAALGKLGDASVLPQLRELYELNNLDPTKGVNVRVDTGSAGNRDMNRARAAGKRMERLRRKNGKAVTDAMKVTLEQLCGTKIESPEELKDWMRKNKARWR